MENSQFTADATTTAKWLENYIGDIMKERGLVPKFASYCMENQFGEKIHAQVDGFCKYAQGLNEYDDTIEDMDIQVTLCHDLGGALNQDKMMLPRVSEYGKYSK